MSIKFEWDEVSDDHVTSYRKGFNEGYHKARQSPRNSTNWWEEDQWQYEIDSAPKGILLLVCTSNKTEDGEELNFVVAKRIGGGWIAAHGRNGKIYDSIKCWMRFSIPWIRYREGGEASCSRRDSLGC